MSAMTGETVQPTESLQANVGLVNVVRAEWTKLWSVRSTMWTLLILVAITIGFGALVSWGVASTFGEQSPADQAAFDATSLSLAGALFGQLAMVVLGALFITTEYSTGGIRTTLTAVPRRLRVLWAKALVLAAVSWVIGTVTMFVAFFVGQAFFAAEGLEASLDDPGVLRAVFGGGLYLLGCALFGFAIGVVLRHSAGAISAAIALLLVVPPLTLLLPGDWGDAVNRYFTSNAGGAITVVNQSDPNQLGPWAGYGVFTLWWVVILAIGAVLMVRRDA
jgi:ABC-2 type transport system permease protein